VVGRILLAPRGAIRHRRWFAVADYVNTFLSALGGLISVAIRLVTAIGFVPSPFPFSLLSRRSELSADANRCWTGGVRC
jgi:hypothetical protein